MFSILVEDGNTHLSEIYKLHNYVIDCVGVHVCVCVHMCLKNLCYILWLWFVATRFIFQGCPLLK